MTRTRFEFATGRGVAAILFAASTMVMHVSTPAEACGVKLTVKSSGPRKAVARTSNPSDILVLGDPPRRLEGDLSAAGHHVEVAPHASAAKRKSYAVVVTDAPLQGEARDSFPDAIVIVRSDDTTADVRSVEQQVARRPVRTGDRAVVAASARRTPIAAGPAQPTRQVVAAAPPSDPDRTTETPAPTPTPAPPKPPTPAPERVATTAPARPAEPAPRPVKPDPAPAAAKSGDVRYEVYFATGASALSTDGARALNGAVRWLKASGDVQVVVEGHADPTGSPDANMALAQKRAEWVRDYLISQGVDAARLDVISYGDTRLKYAKTSSRNRRAAIVVK